MLEDLSTWVCEDGKRTLCRGFVHSNQFRRAAADDDDGGRDGHGEVCLHVDLLRECFDVGLTCLCGQRLVGLLCFNRAGLQSETLTPQ